MYKLKEILRERGLKQRWLSKQLGVDETQLSRWINGINKPNYEIIKKICKILDIKPEIFFIDNTETDISLSNNQKAG